MIVTFIASIVLSRAVGQTPVQDPAVTAPKVEKKVASKLISAMLAKYMNAKTVYGKILLTASTNEGAVKVETNLAISHPLKIALSQFKVNSPKNVVALLCDGKKYSYNPPKTGLSENPPRVLSELDEGTQEAQYHDLYMLQRQQLFDESPILQVVMGIKSLDRDFVKQIPTFSYKGQLTVRGKKVDVISGQWKSEPDGQVAGTFEMHLTEDGDLFNFVTKQNYATGGRTITVTYLWEADLKIGVDIPDSIFKVH